MGVELPELRALTGRLCRLDLSNATVKSIVGTLEDPGRYFPYRVRVRTRDGAMWTPPVWLIDAIEPLDDPPREPA